MKDINWTAENIADQKGTTAIVTGSSSGIGFEAARVLANKDATQIVATSNLEKGEAAEKIPAQNKDAKVRVLQLDLADLASVAEFAEEFKKTHAQLDLLINNAGVMTPPFSKIEDGFELRFGTNHLGSFALTAHPLEVLRNSCSLRISRIL